MFKFICDYCGKEYYKNARRSYYKNHYCSKECKYLACRKTNKILYENDYAYIQIIKNEEVYKVLFDIEDLEVVQNHKWYLGLNPQNQLYYVHGWSRGQNTHIKLHRLITNCPKGFIVDHINRNPLDNRKCYLRICTTRENKQNQITQKNNKSSGHQNVYWDDIQKKWRVGLRINRKLTYFGRYTNLEDAVNKAKEVRAIYFPYSIEALNNTES